MQAEEGQGQAQAFQAQAPAHQTQAPLVSAIWRWETCYVILPAQSQMWKFVCRSEHLGVVEVEGEREVKPKPKIKLKAKPNL